MSALNDALRFAALGFGAILTAAWSTFLGYELVRALDYLI